jgi:hypothetical protein
MAVKSEKIEGKIILCEFDSTNLKSAKYNTEDESLLVTFGNGGQYEYENVPHKEFVKLRLAESNGKYFNTEISKKYKYKKLTN